MKKLFALLLLVLLTPVLSFAKEEVDKEGWLGVYSKNLSKPVRIAMNVNKGVIITGVAKNSPAENGGIEIGDIILKIDGKDINNKNDLVKLVRNNPNKQVEVEIQRQAKLKKISLIIGEREKESYEFKKPGKTWKKIKKYFQEFKPFWEKGTNKYQEEMKRLKEELKDLREQLKELRKELTEKLKEK